MKPELCYIACEESGNLYKLSDRHSQELRQRWPNWNRQLDPDPEMLAFIMAHRRLVASKENFLITTITPY